MGVVRVWSGKRGLSASVKGWLSLAEGAAAGWGVVLGAAVGTELLMVGGVQAHNLRWLQVVPAGGVRESWGRLLSGAR